MSATTPPTRTSVPDVRRPALDHRALDHPALDVGLPRVVPAPALLAVAPTPPGPPWDQALLPNLLVAGVSHAGAAMLAADLGRHPQLCLPEGRRPGLFTALRYGRSVEVQPHDYDRHFARWSGERYRVETSPDYFDGGRPMAETLAERLPALRVIVLLRDPAHRLWTSYTDKLARSRLPSAISFDTFVDRCLALRANGADRFEGNRHFRTLSSGFYVEHLPHWLDVFGPRLRIVFTEDLQEDPVAQVRGLFDWLGLDVAEASPPSAADDDRADGGQGGYPAPEPAPVPFNRRLWPVLQRAPGPWRQPGPAAGSPARLPRQSDRARTRIRALYAAANRELAELLRERGITALPGWLAEG